jgi:CRP-like cAMP-binding protein
MRGKEGALGRDFLDGEIICRQGDVGECAYVMQAGRAVVIREEEGSAAVVGRLAPGDVFGEMALFEHEPRAATVRAEGPTRVLTLDKKSFVRRIHEDPSLAYRLLLGMSGRIRRLDTEVARLRGKAPAGTVDGP